MPGLVEVQNLSSPFLLFAIYANPKFETRKLLWNELCVMARTVTVPWVVLGDFNEVVWQSD